MARGKKQKAAKATPKAEAPKAEEPKAEEVKKGGGMFALSRGTAMGRQARWRFFQFQLVGTYVHMCHFSSSGQLVGWNCCWYVGTAIRLGTWQLNFWHPRNQRFVGGRDGPGF